MTWTYSDTDLSTTLAKVRSTIGDTNANDQLLTDEEIQVKIDLNGSNILRISADCVRLILAKIARRIDRSNDGMSATRSQMTQHYKDLLDELNARAQEAGARMFVGGAYDSDNDTLDSDSDVVQPRFRVNQFSTYYGNNPGSGDDDAC